MTEAKPLTLYSTMGAALSANEAETIFDSWFRLGAAVEDLALVAEDDQVRMLDAAANIVGLISELRTAIYNGWHGANARAFPGPKPRPKPYKVNLTTEDLNKVLDYISKLEESR